MKKLARFRNVTAAVVILPLMMSCNDDHSTLTGPDSFTEPPQQQTATLQAATSARPLLAGTSVPGMVYRYDGSSWTAISGDLGFAVLDLAWFAGDIYAATGNHQSPTSHVYRYVGGTSWEIVQTFSNYQVASLAVWNGDLYAGVAYGSGEGDLYRLNAAKTAFDFVGQVPSTDSQGHAYVWWGIRSMYPWSETGDLHLGDWAWDVFGRWDGTSLINDRFMDGSCIFDFAPFNGRLYAGAYRGRLLWSDTGIGDTWDYSYILSAEYPYAPPKIWELEPFKGVLYIGDEYGNLSYINATHALTQVWSSGTKLTKAVTAMTTDGDDDLYFGTGAEAGYWGYNVGSARVYAYAGTSPTEIFDADAGDTSYDHAGIQVLYLIPVVGIDVDIKPGSDPNCINPNGGGRVAVAILSSPEFDIHDVDVGTVTLEGVVPVKWADNKDVGGDPTADLVFHFDTRDLSDAGLLVDGAVLELTGLTVVGEPIAGSDIVYESGLDTCEMYDDG